MRAQKHREEEDVTQLKKLYRINFLDKKHYKLVIDTTNLTPEETAENILEHVKEHYKEE